MSLRIGRWCVLAFALLLVACTGNLLQSKVDMPQVYVIAPVDVQPGSVAYPVQLTVSLPGAAPGLDTERIAALREGNRLDHFYGVRWGSTAPHVVQSFIVSLLQAQQNYKGVIAEGARIDSDYLLELDLRSFHAEYGAGSAPVVHVSLAATLVHIKSRRALGLVRADAHVPAAENRLGAVVPAFQKALQEAALSISDQVAALLQKEP